MRFKLFLIIPFFFFFLSVSTSQINDYKISIGVNIGYSTFMMNDINKYIRYNYNDVGFNFNEINSCINYGGQINYHFSNRLAVRLGFNYFNPPKQSSSIPVYFTDVQGAIFGKGKLDLSINTNAFTINLQPVYKFSQNKKFRFLAGIGVIYSKGKLLMEAEENKNSYSENIKWDNTNIGFLGSCEIEFYLIDFLSIFGEFSIQYNKIKELKDEDGQTVQISKYILNDGKINLDYSGVNLNFGILIYPTYFFKNEK
ncbi:MAG: hypothetical protein K8S16_16210 [Bacteroidales bacterium]|nr:hypothetical protein [Bacteroidales bacterium]